MSIKNELVITAENSSGNMKLHLDRTVEGIFITLTGIRDGNPIQIDFDLLSEKESRIVGSWLMCMDPQS